MSSVVPSVDTPSETMTDFKSVERMQEVGNSRFEFMFAIELIKLKLLCMCP